MKYKIGNIVKNTPHITYTKGDACAQCAEHRGKPTKEVCMLLLRPAPLMALLILLLCSSAHAGVPARIKVSKADGITNTNDSEGNVVSCITFKGQTYAGVLTKNGKFFKTTTRRVKKAIAKLKKKKKSANKKKAKKFRKKIKAQKAKKTREEAACTADNGGGGGEGGGGGGEDPADLLKPLSRALTNEDIRYLTEKAGFGFGAAEQNLLDLKSQGAPAVVSEFMRVKAEDSAFANTYTNWLDGNLEVEEDTSFEGIRRAWIYAMQNGNNPYRERFALWLFALWTAAEDVLEADEAFLLSDYINGNSAIPLPGIRGYAYEPNMREMAKDMSRSAMMLLYLDGASNIKDNPNENFARELFELFTTSPEDLDGNPNYTEEGDIVKAASALTGWRVSNGERGFSPFDQDTNTFVLFEGTGYDCSVGGSGQGKMDRVIDCIFDNHPNVANYYASELLKEYLTPTPSKSLVQALAAVIEDNNFNLDEAMRVLLSSEIFYSDTYKNTVAKNSVEFAIETVRTLGIPLDTDDLELWIRKMGMSLTSSPTVFWFPDSTWTSAPVKLEAINFLSQVLEDDYLEKGWVPTDILPSGTPQASAVIALAANTLGVTVNAEQSDQITAFLNRRRNGDSNYSDDPYDQSISTHQRERGLGVYQILGMSIDYQMK